MNHQPLLPIGLPVSKINKMIGKSTIMLYGSYANGTNKAESDIDLIVISDHFNGLSQYIRRSIFRSCINSNSIILDAICMTQKEFAEYRTSHAYAVENPIVIYGGSV